jgi:hypothetical protein
MNTETDGCTPTTDVHSHPYIIAAPHHMWESFICTSPHLTSRTHACTHARTHARTHTHAHHPSLAYPPPSIIQPSAGDRPAVPRGRRKPPGRLPSHPGHHTCVHRPLQGAPQPRTTLNDGSFSGLPVNAAPRAPPKTALALPQLRPEILPRSPFCRLHAFEWGPL